MKLLLGLLVSLAISSAFALPAGSPKDEVDVVEVPRGPQRSDADTTSDDTDVVDRDFKDFKGIVDTGAGYPFLDPLPRPFSFNLGFFDSFDDIFRRLRTRLWSVDSDSDETSEEGGFGLGLNPMNGANTTSVVKVVDGHKIEINDTVIGNGDGHGGALFKFRIINIRPLESGEEVAETATQAPTTELENTATPKRDIEGNSEETKSSEENEINANVDDPENTTEAITTEMLDTGIPSLDNNAIDNDSPVNQDELQGDTTPTTEGLDAAGDVATLSEDTQNPDGDAIKNEELSELADTENVNEEGIKLESSSEEEKEGADGEINESIVVNQNAEEVEGLVELLNEQQELAALREKQMQALVDSVGEKLSMADADEERFTDEVEKMVSANDEDSIVDDNDDEAVEESTQKPSNQKHSMREDLSSSDEEDVNEDGDNSKNEGLETEWGGASLDDKNILTNEIDVYETLPIDLSNDVAINDIMADQGVQINPDAEIFNVEELAPSVAGVAEGVKRFEVLSDIK